MQLIKKFTIPYTTNKKQTMSEEKLTHYTKTSLREESKLYLPTVREFYPHLDGMLTDRIAKYCAIYSKGTDKASIRQAINDFEEVFDQELTQ